MSKTSRKILKQSQNNDYTNEQHIVKKQKHIKNKAPRNFDNALKSKDIKKILSYEEAF